MLARKISHTPAQQPETPLVNLFAFIRDLYQSEGSSLRFDQKGETRTEEGRDWWQLGPLHDIIGGIGGPLGAHWQWDDPEKPLLRLQPVDLAEAPDCPETLVNWIEIRPKAADPVSPLPHQVVNFDADPARVQAWEAWQQTFKETPAEAVLPEILEDWVMLESTESDPQPTVLPQKEVAFEADELRVELFKAFRRQYLEWKEEHAATEALHLAYEQLHEACFRVQGDDGLSLYLSMGQVAWSDGEDIYRQFLFHFPVKLMLQGPEILLVPDTLDRGIELDDKVLDWLEHLDPSNFATQQSARHARMLRSIEAWNQNGHQFDLTQDYLKLHLYQPARELLAVFAGVKDEFFEGNNLNWEWPEGIKAKRLHLRFSPVLQIRDEAAQQHIVQDAARVIACINRLGAEGRNEEIPDFFKKMFSLRRAGNPLRIAFRRANLRSSATPEISQELAAPRLRFPLPYNAEQQAIADRLWEQDAVTVKGPPGTGKSHTIANMMAHTVAQGKSVLVVSKNPKALEVIREKLPREIRDLALALVNPTGVQTQLKHAIDAIKDKLAQEFDPETLARHEQKLDDLEAEFALQMEVLEQLAAQQGGTLISFHPESGELMELSLEAWLDIIKSHPPMYEWKDALPETDEIDALAKQLALVRPELESLEEAPTPASLSGFEWMVPEVVHEAIPQIENPLVGPWSDWNPNAWNALLGTLWADTIPALDILRRWDQTLASLPSQEIQAFLNQQDQLTRLQQRIEGVHADLGGWTPLTDTQVLGDLTELENRFGGGERLSKLQRTLLPKRYARFFHWRINQRPVETFQDVQILRDLITAELTRAEITQHLGRMRAQGWIPAKIETAEALAETLRSQARARTQVRTWNEAAAPHGWPTFGQRHGDWGDQIEQITLFPQWWDQQQVLNQWERQLAAWAYPQATHPIEADMREALANRDLEAYQTAFSAWQQLCEEAVAIEAAEALEEQLAEIYPALWAEKEAGIWPVLAESEWAHALRYARLRMDIARQGEGETPLAEALANLQALRQQIEQQTAKVVGYRTWYHKQQQITDTEKAALMAWRNDLVNTGKGHGKNAARNMESAVRNLKVAKGAVPVWIMSQDAAIRFFPEVQPGQFDLLIVDEASQCDISLLNLMFRARKTMVVGDENQTSVSVNSNQFPIERTNRLLDRYLSQHPFREQFNINNRTTSVYTLSSVIYPNIVSLREHFRCRPEIISFSNQHMYDGRITPLKSATNDRFGDPLVGHYVEDDPKDPSKPQIVQQALTLIEDLVKDFEAGVLDKLPTVGILCLDASNEAHRDKLNSVLSRSQVLRPYADELGLLVGTSREFQGDERDIMILTTTASHRFTPKGKIRPPRAVLGEEMSRIYNVAASRAREKMLLLHSIHPEAVSLMKPECLRFQLIRHCEGDGEERQIRRVAKGQRPQWEKELSQTLGADWQADYPVGQETLDWASMAGGRKRAVVVWGRTPVARLLVLMRAGWQLFPVSALGWQLNAEAIKAALKEWIG